MNTEIRLSRERDNETVYINHAQKTPKYSSVELSFPQSLEQKIQPSCSYEYKKNAHWRTVKTRIIEIHVYTVGFYST